MYKLILIVVVCCLNAEIVIDTQISNKNISIYKDGKISPHFDPKNRNETSCHPSPLYIEQNNNPQREFYIHNLDSKNIQLEINSRTVELPANSTIMYQEIYTCPHNWYDVKIRFQNITIEYIKMCEPLQTPLHPVIILLFAAIILVYLGSAYGQTHVFLFGEEQHGDIDAMSAIYFVFVASTGLMVLYLFGEYIQIFLQLWVMFVGFTALQNGLSDIASSLLKLGNGSQFTLPYFGQTSEKKILTGIIAIIIVVYYFLSKNWMISNVIAISLVMLMFKLIEVDSLRTATILLSLAFFYDIFWVFYSHIFFGESVMAQVATQIDLPMKLQCPEIFTFTYPVARCSLIGLGDIILPGIVLKYAMRCDNSFGSKRLFPVAYVGYILGLFMCMFCLIVYKMAQPALLYLVPCILLPVILTSLRSSNFKAIWRGELEKGKNDSQRIQQIDQDYELTAGEI